MTALLTSICLVSGNVAAQEQISKAPWKTQMDGAAWGCLRKAAALTDTLGETQGPPGWRSPPLPDCALQAPSCLLRLPVSQRGVPALLSQVRLWVASPRSGPQLQPRGAGRPGIKQRGRVLGSFRSLAAAERSHVPTCGGRGCWRAAPQPPSASRPRCPSLPWARGRWRRRTLRLDACRAHAHGLLSGQGTREAWRSWSEVLGCCSEARRLDCKPLHCPEAPCRGLSSPGGGVAHPTSPGPALGRRGTVPSCQLIRGGAGAAVTGWLHGFWWRSGPQS